MGRAPEHGNGRLCRAGRPGPGRGRGRKGVCGVRAGRGGGDCPLALHFFDAGMVSASNDGNGDIHIGHSGLVDAVLLFLSFASDIRG